MSSRASLNHFYRTVWNHALGCAVAVAENAPSSAGRGSGSVQSVVFPHQPVTRLALLSLAVALGWGLAGVARANPTGGVAIVGQATFNSTQPNHLLVTTQNGAGTNYSAINWQSFSIPSGSTTRIEQPNAASLSINRVVTNTPTTLFGTLSSNGKVVLVNQSGIAVGQGAVVDTAGFTASTLAMSDADARAGRSRFATDGGATGALQVQGQVIARGGDVVLVAPSVEVAKTAVVEAPNGAVVLAAGQSVDVTGRGLEGIRLNVQAPQDQALNLGTLKGDAVGIFAGTLKHSGDIRATQATVDGGRVLLKASGDAYVEGNGQIAALRADAVGGFVQVSGNRVALADTASIDVSAARGGGTALLGGDAHGVHAGVPNAQVTYVGADTRIAADATEKGNGGKVVVWADDATQFNGHISAKGGVLGGDGGWVETSGKRYLGFSGLVDTMAPRGTIGSLLLDPVDVYISGATLMPTPSISGGVFTYPSASVAYLTPALIESNLATSNVTIDAASGSGSGSGNITVWDAVTWTSGNTLKLKAGNAISIQNSLDGSSGGTVVLEAGSGGISRNTAPLAYIKADKLEIISGGDAILTGANAVQVNTVAANVSGVLDLENYTPGSSITVGTVGSTSGLSATGNLRLIEYTSGANIQVNENVWAGGTMTVQQGSSTGSATLAAGKTMSGSDSEFIAPSGVTINGTVSGSSSARVHTGLAGGGITTGAGGLVSAPVIHLQDVPTSVGAIGSPGSPFRTGGGTDVYVGASGYGPNGVYIKHTGNLHLKPMNIEGSAPVQVQTDSDLTLYTSINTNAPNDAIVLAASGSFSDGGYTLSAPSGRWLVYASCPSCTNLYSNGTSVDFQQYNVAAMGSVAQSTGNGVIYGSNSIAVVTVPVTLTGTVSKTYDSTTSASLSSSNYSLALPANSDPIFGTTPSTVTLATVGTGTYDTPNAGSGKTVTSTGGTAHADFTGGKKVYGYILETANAAIGTINPALLTITGSLIGTAVRDYDGTTVANLKPSNFSLSGFSGSDGASVTKTTGTYASPDVGQNIAVTATLTGSDFSPTGSTILSNYILPTSVTGNIGEIKPKPLTTSITAANKVYDGNTDATLAPASFSISGLVSGDAIQINQTLGSYSSKDVGTGITVTADLDHSHFLPQGPTNLANYKLPLQAIGNVGEITQRPLSTWTGAANNQWSNPLNWDALPDANNVLAVSIPAGAQVVFDASVATTTLKSLSSASPVTLSGSNLQITDGFSAAGFTQTGGVLRGKGSFNVTGPFTQSAGTVEWGNTMVVAAPTGSIVFSDLTAPAVNLTATAGSVTGNGPVVADALTVTSATGAVMNSNENRIKTFLAMNTGSGNIELTNTGALTVLGIHNVGGGIVMNNTGGITTTGAVTAPSAVGISLTANSPLTIGTDGVSSGGNVVLTATNLTSAGDVTLNGPINSTEGTVVLNAANNMTQNAVVYGAKGVTAKVGGTLTLTAAAKAGATPVSYTVGGSAATPPPSTETPVVVDPIAPPSSGPIPGTGTFDPVQSAIMQTNLITTFLDKFELALQQTQDDPNDKDRERRGLVVEGGICPR